MRTQPRFLLPAIFGLLALGLVLVLVVGGSKGAKPASTSQTEAFDGATLPPGTQAPNFTLTDQNGRAVSLGSHRGRVVMLVFLPAGAPSRLGVDCRACVLVAQQVRGALDELGSRAHVQALFVSGDLPMRGSANRLFAQTSLSTRAEYLTGDEVEVGRVWRTYRIPLPVSINSKAEAAVTVVLIDGRGFERVAFGIEQITPEALSHDIRLLEGA